MSETKRMVGSHNYDLNSAVALRDVYRLLAQVLADVQIAREANDGDDPLAKLRERFVEEEIVHLLIGTAVINRARLDHMAQVRSDPGTGLLPVDHECGSFQPDITADNEVALSFREACNKIIHAKHITCEPTGDEDDAFPSLQSVWTLRGNHRDSAWQAHLFLPDYVRASVINFSDVK